MSGGAGLPDLAIHSRSDLDAGRGVEAVGDQRADRAEGIEAFGAGPLAVFVLQIASGEIIHAGVAEDVGAYVFALGEPVAPPGDHDAQFPLVVGARGNFWSKNRATRRQQGGWRLEK